VAAVTAALLLCLPASSFASGDRATNPKTEQGESSVTALRSAGVLARGSGYASQAGSKAVRELQLRLRRLGHRPGPVDGLFGPLTEASVERFQRARALQVDGVVGARTRARLLALPVRRPAPQGSPAPKPDGTDRQAPNRPAPPDVAPPRDTAPDATPARPAAPEPASSDGLEPWFAAVLGALAMGVVLAGLSKLRRARRREPATERAGPASPSPGSRLNLGMAFAVLLAVFAMGAAIGALFATHAAPGDGDGAEVASGALLSPPAAPRVQAARPAEPPPKERPAVAARRRPPAPRPASTAPTPTPRPATPELREPGGASGSGPAAAGSPATATAPAPPVIPVEEPGGSYTARPDESPPPIAEHEPEEGSADAAIARRVKRLFDPDLEDRFSPGDPNLLTAREQRTLP
jgi:Putative peptidoglycan binding domain